MTNTLSRLILSTATRFCIGMALSCLIVMAIHSGIFARSNPPITAAEIKKLEQSGHLIRTGTTAWRTRGGLILSGKDSKKHHRLYHIMRHTRNMPRRPRHGVFSIPKSEIIDLMDACWKKIQSGKVKGKTRGGRIAYTIRTGTIVGYLGGKQGLSQGHPKLRKVRIVLKENTPRIITFFPVP